ncbi:LysR family transcriptional regulator [Variovorax sp. GT1P44]|uniref:LysR family transcriptional regulator n=1 Tax=Variovorax sp. GT1P44 TaxID=3443742 RepID=UPI003F472534
MLRVYEALMSEGSVTRAAVKLSRTQPAISNSLARLRETLGDPVFEKTATGIRPTARGRESWAQLEPHWRGLEEALSSRGFDPSLYGGRFRVAMADYILYWMMPRLASKLETVAPGVRIDAIPSRVVGMEAQFERGGLDMYVGPHSPTTGDIVLRLHALWHFNFRCLMRRGHPLASGKLTLKRYLQARHMDVLTQGSASPLYETVLEARGVRRQIALTINSWLPIAAVVAESDLVATVPIPIVDLGSYASRVCERDLPIPIPTKQVNLIWHRRNDADPAHQWLRNLIIEMFAEEKSPG